VDHLTTRVHESLTVWRSLTWLGLGLVRVVPEDRLNEAIYVYSSVGYARETRIHRLVSRNLLSDALSAGFCPLVLCLLLSHYWVFIQFLVVCSCRWVLSTVLVERHVCQSRLLLQWTHCNLVPARRCFRGTSVSLDLVWVLHQVVDASLRIYLSWVQYLRRWLGLIVIRHLLKRAL